MTPELLKKGLYVNAIFSGLAGLVLAAAPVAVGGLLMPAVPLWAVMAIGIGLVLFALDVAWVAASRVHSALFVGAVLAADIAWVVGVPAVLVLAPSAFTPLGIFMALASTVAVAGFAVMEWKGLRMISATGQPA